MRQVAEQPSTATRAGVGPARDVPRHRAAGWVLAVPPAVTLAVMLWGITAPSYWRDESATLSATSRSLPQLLRMLGRVDVVHGAYYVLLWPVVQLLGTGEFVTRLPSAIAMAAAALGIAAIGNKLRSRRAGLYAGLVFASLPMVSIRGHDARPYAMVTAVAVLAGYLLIRAIDQPRPRRFAAYGASVAALGYLHVFALLLIPAHAIMMIRAARNQDPRRGEPLLRWWTVAVVAAAVTITPVAALGWQQRGQISWLTRPGLQDIYALLDSLAAGTGASVLVITALILFGALRPDRPANPRTATGPWGRDGRELTWLAAGWLVIPPAILLAVSQIMPVYEFMYIAFCLPAVALLAGAGLSAIARPVRIAALLLVVGLGLPAQLAIRESSAGGSFRSAAEILQRHEHRGDAVFYPQPEVPTWNLTYPAAFAPLRDIGQAETPAQAHRLTGTPVPITVLEHRFQHVHRLWVIELGPMWQNPAIDLSRWFRHEHAWQAGDMELRLYTGRLPHVRRA